MKQITFYLDFISPYAWLAFQQIPKALAGISHGVTCKPVLFGAILGHHGQLGPAEVPAKRDWTYRQVLWLGRELGVDIHMPAEHPFNPLVLLRLATACDAQGLPNRHVCETVFRHVWIGGASALDPQRLQALQLQLAPAREPDEASVKLQLKIHTEEAIAAGVFGVPSFAVDDLVFWGLDALPMLRAYLLGDEWFAPGATWERAPQVSVGIRRNPSA
jgi:2-hydroxychromene-2-carboxylate isomerase